MHSSRRDFLRLSAASVTAFAATNSSNALGQMVPVKPFYSPIHPTPFIDPLPIPVRMQAAGKQQGRDFYQVRMVEFQRRLHSELPPAKLWGYEAAWPGPTFEAMRGDPIVVEWHNELPLQPLIPVDTSLPSCRPPVPLVRAVPHLHGSRTDSYSDGLPENWFTPGHSVVYHYPNEQRATALWYHDHACGVHRLNFYAGMAGFYLLRDAQELSMDLPSGDYEIPLMLQDRTVDEHGQLVYAPVQDDWTLVPSGKWGPMVFGDLPVVNGAIAPAFEVEPRLYRFRVLNGANTRFFRLYLNLAKSATDVPDLVNFHQIGSDGGLLAAPVKLQHLLLAPAERADLIVDFTGLAGKTVTLSNDAPSPYPGWDMIKALFPPLLELMQFRVTRPLKPSTKTFRMALPIPLPRLTPSQSVTTRDFVLTDDMDKAGKSLRMLIDGKPYSAPATVFPVFGSIETWRFINTTDDAHPMHLHLVQYQILQRQSFDRGTFQVDKRLQFTGPSRPPQANEAGWKDTAIVNPGEVLTILVPFLGFTGKYLFHCHVAEHADNDMMRPFVVIEPGTRPTTETQPSGS